MNTSRKLFWRNSFNFGSLLGGMMVLSSFLYYVKGMSLDSSSLLNIFIILSVIAMILSVRKFRDTYGNGEIKFSKSLGICITTMLIASVYTAIFSYIIHSTDESLINLYLERVKVGYLAMGLNDQQAEIFIDSFKSLNISLLVAFGEIFNKILGGLIGGLVISAMFRKRIVRP